MNVARVVNGRKGWKELKNPRFYALNVMTRSLQKEPNKRWNNLCMTNSNIAVILKRTFDQPTCDSNLRPNGCIRFWRVMSEGHPNYGSDLSADGLRAWGII